MSTCLDKTTSRANTVSELMISCHPNTCNSWETKVGQDRILNLDIKITINVSVDKTTKAIFAVFVTLVT